MWASIIVFFRFVAPLRLKAWIGFLTQQSSGRQVGMRLSHWGGLGAWPGLNRSSDHWHSPLQRAGRQLLAAYLQQGDERFLQRALSSMGERAREPANVIIR